MKYLYKFVFLIAFAVSGATLGLAVQNATTVNNATNTSGFYAPQHLDAGGNLLVNDAGTSTSLAVSGVAAVIKTGVGRIVSVNVLSASGVGAIYDTASTGTAATANQIAIIPATAGSYQFNFPFVNGLVINPASSTISVNYQ